MKDNDFDFSELTLIEFPVKIGDKECVLREASEDAARQYQNALTRHTSIEDGKVRGIMGPIADTQSLFVSLCMFESSDDGKERRVDVKEVRKWPARVVKKLFDKAKEISEIGEDGDTIESLEKQIAELQERLDDLRGDELGNAQSDTGGGSD